MENTWIYTEYNYTTQLWDVIKQERLKGDVVLKSFKREGNAHNYELKIKYPLESKLLNN